MISRVGMPDALSSGTVNVIGMVTRVVFIKHIKNCRSERSVPRPHDTCKPTRANSTHCPKIVGETLVVALMVARPSPLPFAGEG